MSDPARQQQQQLCAVIVFVTSLVCARTTGAQLLDDPGACTTAAAIAHRAKQLCSAPIDQSLQSVFDLGPGAARMAGRALRDHGFRSSLDLEMLEGHVRSVVASTEASKTPPLRLILLLYGVEPRHV